METKKQTKKRCPKCLKEMGLLRNQDKEELDGEWWCSKCEEKHFEFVVIWHYMANYGRREVITTSPQEAIKEVYQGNTKDITYLVVEKKNLVVFEKTNKD